MAVVQAALLGLTAVLLAAQLKPLKPEYAVYLVLAASIGVGFLGLARLGVLLDTLREIGNGIRIRHVDLAALFKMAGITYIAEFTSRILCGGNPGGDGWEAGDPRGERAGGAVAGGDIEGVYGMRWKRNVFLMLGLVMGIFWGIRQSEVTAFAAEQTGVRQKTGRQAGLWTIPMPTAETVDFGQRAEPQQEDEIADIDVTEIQEYLDQIGGDDTAGLTFRDLMDMIRKGDAENVFLYGKDRIVSALFSEIRTNTSFLAEILILSLCGAACSGFFGIFGSSQLSETGAYVICICVQTFLAASFFASIRIAEETTGDILGFMKVLLPAYFLAVTMAGGAVTSASVCGFTLGAIGVIQAVVSGFLLPIMKLYMVLSLVGNLFREEMFSVMTEFLGKVVGWTVKTMFGIVVGFHLIQGLVLPQADAMKNAAVVRTIEAVPGIGAGAGAMSNLLMGSAVLIKNTAGAAAVAVLIFLASVPMVKLAVLMALYYLAAAVMQPVCDKRLAACMAQNAVGHGMLLEIVGYSLALFAVTIAVISYSTNAVYYAG